MIAPSIQTQLHFSPFCSSNYNKSATIQRHHPHQHQSKVATRRRKHESQRSFTRTTLDIIPEDQQQQDACCGQDCNKAGQRRINPVIATDFWHSTRSLKKSATSVSLDSLAAANETNNDENQMPNATGHIHVKLGGPNIVLDDDYDNFLEDWEL